MTTRLQRRYRIAAAAVLVAAAAVATYELARGPGETAGSLEQMARANPVQVNRGAETSAPEPPALALATLALALATPEAPETTASPRVDIARVEAALARMKASAARISREQIIEEQKRMDEAKARFEAIKIPEPMKRPFTGENGTRWIELQYESGEIRYELAPEPETPEVESAR
jgi:hypothetical protein